MTAVYNEQRIAPDATLAAGAITLTGRATAAVAGGSQPVGNAPPFLVMNYCIALEGIYPSRN